MRESIAKIWWRSLSRGLHPSWCFYATVWGIIIGIAGGVCWEWILLDSALVVLIMITIVVACWCFSCRVVLVLSLLAGILLGNYRAAVEVTGKMIAEQYAGRSVNIVGTLAEDADTSSGNTVVRLKNLQLSFTHDNYEEKLEIAGMIYATLAHAPPLERSDRIELSGKLNAGFGTFVATMYRAEVVSIERSETGDIFARFKQWFADRVRDTIPSPEVELGLGYLMGMKSGLPEDFATALQMVGMTHVVVASGAHLAILTDAAKKLFGKISKFAGVLFSLLLILIFVLIVGFTPSMTRAALVAGLSLLVGYVGRKFTPLRLISFVAMLTLMISPIYLLNLGWQLSFASFFGILVVGPRLQTVLYGGKKPPWLAGMLMTSIATSLACVPILIYNFGSISFLALVANLIILPTLPYAMLGMMLTGILGGLPALTGVVATLTTWLLDLHILVINYLSEQKAFILDLPAADARFYLLYIPVLGFVFYPALKKLYCSMKRRMKPLLPVQSEKLIEPEL